MIRSSRGGFIFVHIQKTAGTSIEQVLRRSFPDAGGWLGRHSHAAMGIAEIGPDEWNRHFTFSFVRNPWSRMVSWYAMLRAQFKHLPDAKRHSSAPFPSAFWNHAIMDAHDFPSFLRNCTKTIVEGGCPKSYVFNQVEYLVDGSGELAVDFVGRFERLEEDTQNAFRRLGIRPQPLPRSNRSRHQHYSGYYTPYTRDLVARRFARDIEMFDYRFESA